MLTDRETDEDIEKIMKIYESCKHIFGRTPRIRRRACMSMLRASFPAIPVRAIEHTFAQRILPRDTQYLSKLREKRLRIVYSNAVRMLFGSIDENGDGCIDFDEFRSALCNLELEDVDADALFQQFDFNDDGVLDPDEFYALVASHPILCDNFDRIVSNCEHKQSRRQRLIFACYVTHRRPSLCDLRR